MNFFMYVKFNCLNLGEAYLPFNEMPELKNIVLTGREDNEIDAIGK